jgi:hypothetical protein
VPLDQPRVRDELLVVAGALQEDVLGVDCGDDQAGLRALGADRGCTDLLQNGNEREIALDQGEPFLERVTLRN